LRKYCEENEIVHILALIAISPGKKQNLNSNRHNILIDLE